MKKIFIFSALVIAGLFAKAQSPTGDTSKPSSVALADTTQKVQIVEAACGQCKFGLAGSGCSLAVRMNGKAYFVDGTILDGHGDAHAADGMCNAIRTAEVKGMVVNNRFKATSFKLQPAKKKG
jgi:hypothetical protein